jgi:Kdo2-lipid IVA lauroyltransferase/acyltransferase
MMAKKIKYIPIYLLSYLPMQLLYLLSDIAYLILYYAIGYRKKTVRTNLVGSFPEKSPEEIIKIEKGFYQHFADLLVESIKLISINERDIRRRFKVNNPELFEKYYHEGRSVIMYSAHLGNWEWLAAMPFYLKHQAATFYQPLASTYFEELQKNSRERFGAIAVPSAKGYKKLVEFGSRGILTATCIIGDQRPKRKSSSHTINFLHRETPFLIGADRISKKTDQPVVFCHMTKTKRDYYEADLILLEDNPQEAQPEEIIESYAKELERAIHAQPHLWLWSHDRWKTSAGTSPTQLQG